MAFCNSCGKELEPGVKFCGSCGATIVSAGGDAAAAVNPSQAYQDQQAGAAPPPQDAAQQGAAQQGAAPQGAAPQNNSFVDQIMKMVSNTADHTDEMDSADIEKNKFISCLSYLGILFFLPLVACPDSKFGRFHANQGLVLLVLSIACTIATSIISSIFSWIFLWWLASIITYLVRLALIAIAILGIFNTYNGKAKDLPFAGTLRIIR